MKIRIRIRFSREIWFWIVLFAFLIIGILWAYAWQNKMDPMDGWKTVNSEVEESLDQLEQGGLGEVDPAPSFPLSLNTATAAELQHLPGIGPVKAQAIIDYREQAGPFQQIEEIMQVKGIGEKTFEAIKELIAVP